MIETVNAIPEDFGTASPPRLRIQTFTSTVLDPETNDFVASDLRVERVDAAGACVVRGADPVSNKTSVFSVFDYECPFGVPVRYVVTDLGTGQRVTSSTVTLSPTGFYPNNVGFTTTRGAVWLKHLSDTALSMPIDLANAESPQFKQTRSVVDVLNRRTPIVVADARRKNLTSTLDIRTWSLEEAARVREILADNSVLLLDVPAGERWGITHWYIAVGDVTEERLWQEWAPFEGRVFHLPVEIVDRPTGGVVYPACCYASEQRGKGSYYDLNAAHPTYAQLTSCYVPPPPDPDPDPLDPGGTSKPGLKMFSSAIEGDDEDGAVRGPGYWQSTPEDWGPNTFTVDDPDGEEIWFFAQYNVRSSQQPMTLAILLTEAPTFPAAGQVGPLVSSTTEDPISQHTLISVVTPDPLLVPQGTYRATYVVYSNGTWIEAPRFDSTEIRYASGVFLYSRNYTYRAGDAPEFM